jgi:hypothetical protein
LGRWCLWNGMLGPKRLSQGHKEWSIPWEHWMGAQWPGALSCHIEPSSETPHSEHWEPPPAKWSFYVTCNQTWLGFRYRNLLYTGSSFQKNVRLHYSCITLSWYCRLSTRASTELGFQTSLQHSSGPCAGTGPRMNVTISSMCEKGWAIIHHCIVPARFLGFFSSSRSFK